MFVKIIIIFQNTPRNLVSRVKEARKAAASGEGPPVLYLNAGDTYTGTAWFTIYKWKIAAEFLNALKPDAVVSVLSTSYIDKYTSVMFGVFIPLNDVLCFFSVRRWRWMNLLGLAVSMHEASILNTG